MYIIVVYTVFLNTMYLENVPNMYHYVHRITHDYSHTSSSFVLIFLCRRHFSAMPISLGMVT